MINYEEITKVLGKFGIKVKDINTQESSIDSTRDINIRGIMDENYIRAQNSLIEGCNLLSGGIREPFGFWENSYLIERKRIKFNYLPTKIIFSGPATICIFANGSKEVVKKTEDDPDDKEKAVLYCIMKHITKAEFGYFKKNLSNLIEEAENQKQERR